VLDRDGDGYVSRTEAIAGRADAGSSASPGKPAARAVRAKRSPSNEALALIDVHNHLHGQNPRRPGANDDYPGAIRVALASMEEHNIGALVIMPPPFPARHRRRYTSDELIAATREYPGRFFVVGGGGVLNPLVQRTVEAGRTTEADKRTFRAKAEMLAKSGIVGFGELSIEHLCLGPNHHHQNAPADHPLWLILADVAAEYDLPIDFHMEVVPQAMPVPHRLAKYTNPRMLTPNLSAFKRLLQHNGKAKIIWSHVGWDNTGQRAAELVNGLMSEHPNLYMSFKISPKDSVEGTRPIRDGKVKDEWLELIHKYPDRFLIGADQFYLAEGAGQVGPRSLQPTMAFFVALPVELQKKLGQDNPTRLLKLKTD